MSDRYTRTGWITDNGYPYRIDILDSGAVIASIHHSKRNDIDAAGAAKDRLADRLVRLLNANPELPIPSPERTTWTTQRTTMSGTACTTCGTSYAECTRRLFANAGGAACCSRCYREDTHDERGEPTLSQPCDTESPEPVFCTDCDTEVMT